MQRVHLCQHFGCCQEGANLPIALRSPRFSLYCRARDEGCTPWGKTLSHAPCLPASGTSRGSWGTIPRERAWYRCGLTSTPTVSHCLPVGIQPVLHLFKKDYTSGKQLAIWLFMTICAEKEDAQIM